MYKEKKERESSMLSMWNQILSYNALSFGRVESWKLLAAERYWNVRNKSEKMENRREFEKKVEEREITRKKEEIMEITGEGS